MLYRSDTRRRTFLIAAATALGGAAAGLGAGHFMQEQSSGRRDRRFGISMVGSGPTSVEMAEVVGTSLDRPPQVLNFFMAWQWRAPFPAATVEAIRNRQAVPEITWEPWDPRVGATQDSYRLADLSAYDDYVDTFARGCTEYGDEICLRFGHEMNSDWYPWSVSTNGGSPESYIAAYRRLHQRFAAAGATNVRWVWCPNIIYRNQPELIGASYPGDDVVDIVAIDGYNRGGKSPRDLFESSLALLDTIAPSKPLWINEVGCLETPDKPQWITDFFTFLADTRVECVVWFELDLPDSFDWRLMSTPASTAAARSSLANW